MCAQTTFESLKFPGGVVLIKDVTEHPGKIWWVDSTNTLATDAAGVGQNSNFPLATIDYAIALCTASSGDVIYLMPGHAETITTAGGITLDVAGVSIIGLGNGDARPTITFATGAAASMLVSASDCRISNVIFKCNIANQNHMIDCTGDDLEIDHCAFLEGTATGLSFVTSDTDDGDSDFLHIHHCLFYAPTAGLYDAAIQIAKDHANIRIEDNTIYGDFDEAGIDVPAGGNACLHLQIHRNVITNLQSGQHSIQINSTAVTGSASFNMCQTDARATAFDTAALACWENKWCDTDGSNDEEGVPVNVPIADVVSNSLGASEDATTDTVHGKLGTDTEFADNSIYDMLGAQAKTDAISDALCGAAGIATYPAAAAAANAVSVAEVLRYLSEKQLPRTVTRAIDTSSGHGTGDSPVTEFTVTGDVLVRAVGMVTTKIGSVSDTGTLSLGVSDSTAILIPAATADGTELDAGDVWFDATSGTKAGPLPDDGSWVGIAGGSDIVMTIGTNNLNAGAVTVYVQWIPLSATGNVVSTP